MELDRGTYLCVVPQGAAVESTSLTFDQLWEAYSSWQASGKLPEGVLSLQGQLVQIRGFLYVTTVGAREGWILAAEPNLKSCCMGSSTKRGLQLAVNGDLPDQAPATVVALQGRLQLSSGTEGPFYALSDASMLPESSSFGLIGIMLLLMAFVALLAKFLIGKPLSK